MASEITDKMVEAVAKIEMDREGYPLSRTLEEIYADAPETVDAVLDLVESHLSACQYDPAPYACLKRRLAAIRKGAGG